MAAATAGSLLKEAREARGLSLDEVAAATRVRTPYLEALEADEPQRLPAPVYARGYLRTYAQLLELEPEPLLASLRPAAREPDRTVRPVDGRSLPKLPAVTPGIAVLGGLLVAVAALGFYAHHELGLVTVAATRPGAILIASPPVSPSPLKSPAVAAAVAPPAAATAPAGHVPVHRPGPPPGAEVTVALRFTDGVWAYVTVDGKPALGPDGQFFARGDQVTFTGHDISITTGKGAATDVTVDGTDEGYLPDGVTTKDYTPQT